MESLFRYIVVRPPSETNKGKPIPLKSQSGFQVEFQQARDSADDDPLSKIHAQVSSHIKSSSFFIDRRDRLKFGKELNSFVDKIKKDIIPEDIIKEIADATTQIFGISPSDLIEKNEFKKTRLGKYKRFNYCN